MTSRLLSSKPQAELTRPDSRSWRLAILSAIVLLALAAYFATGGHVGDYRVEHYRLRDEPAEPIACRVYFPQSLARPVPGVVLAHGVNNNKETMDLVARELVRRGLVVTSFDFGGHGESYWRVTDAEGDARDLRRVLAEFSRHRAVDERQLAIVGHSIGARAAVEVACGDRRVRAVVATSMSVDAPSGRPRNLLWAAGIYDQCHPPRYLLEDLRRGSGQANAVPDVLYGSMANGTARQLCLSPQTDHLLAPYDPRVIDATVAWIAAGVGEGQGEQTGVRAHRLAAARSCAIIGAALLVFFVATTSLFPWRRRWRNAYSRRVIAVLGGGVVLAPVVGHGLFGGSSVVWADVSMVLLFAFIATNLACRATVNSRAVWQQPALGLLGALQFSALLYLAWTVSVIVGRASYLWENPEYGWSIPAFGLHVLATLPHHLLLKLRMVLFSEYSLNLMPSFALLGLLLVETIIPGEIAYAVCKATGIALNAMRLTGRRSSTGEGVPRRRPTKTARIRQALLLVILAVLIVVLGHRLGEMARDVRLAMGELALRLIVVPVLVAFLLVNIPWLRLGCGLGGSGVESPVD